MIVRKYVQSFIPPPQPILSPKRCKKFKLICLKTFLVNNINLNFQGKKIKLPALDIKHQIK